MSSELQIHVAGKGLNANPVTKRLAVVRLIFTALLSMGTVSVVFFALGWGFFIEKPSTNAIALCAVVAIFSIVAVLLLVRSAPLLKLFALRRNKGTLVFSGYASQLSKIFAKTFICILGVGSIFLFWRVFFLDFPIPSELRILSHTSTFSAPDASSIKRADSEHKNLLPITFWDYVFWIDPAELENLHIVLPYEKGPPQKLLSKIVFLNKETNQVELELNGKRPRTYDPTEIQNMFVEYSFSPRFQPHFWKPLYQLVHEAGLDRAHSDYRLNLPFYWFEIKRVGAAATRAVGLPWESFPALDAPIPTKYSGRFFFLSPPGGVFQVRCPAPCTLAPWLERLYFPDDIKGSFAARKEWTLGILRGLLSDPRQVAEHKNLVLIYLISILSLDPRDPEAFFHVGKLASHIQTLQSAIRYGKDVGLDPARVAELESLVRAAGKR